MMLANFYFIEYAISKFRSALIGSKYIKIELIFQPKSRLKYEEAAFACL